jgi:hypothetical protein
MDTEQRQQSAEAIAFWHENEKSARAIWDEAGGLVGAEKPTVRDSGYVRDVKMPVDCV